MRRARGVADDRIIAAAVKKPHRGTHEGVRRACTRGEMETKGGKIRCIVRLRGEVIIVPPLKSESEARRPASVLPPLRISGLLPIAAAGNVAPEVGRLRVSLARQRCHKRNKRKESKPDEPTADRISTRRRECVGTHFACGWFKQWGDECFSDLIKCAATEEKSSYGRQKFG